MLVIEAERRYGEWREERKKRDRDWRTATGRLYMLGQIERVETRWREKGTIGRVV